MQNWALRDPLGGTMKIAALFLAGLLVPASGTQRPQTGSTGKAKPAFSLNLSAAQSVVKSASPLAMNIVLTDVSNHNIAFPWLASGGGNYQIYVWDSHGNPAQPVPRTWKGKDGRNYARIRGGSMYLIYLNPGQSRKDELDVSESYILTHPGKYTIQVQRADDESKSVVKSNTVTVTIDP
jgi:hypothetical protein